MKVGKFFCMKSTTFSFNDRALKNAKVSEAAYAYRTDNVNKCQKLSIQLEEHATGIFL